MRRNQHHAFGVLRFTSLALIVVVSVSGCDLMVNTKVRNASPEQAATRIEKHIDYLGTRLRVGMSKGEALSFLPKPQNTNSENVCVWAFDFTQNVKRQRRYDWQWLLLAKGGYFLVFVDGRLATPLCASAAFDPWQALQNYAKLSPEQAEQILGRKP